MIDLKQAFKEAFKGLSLWWLPLCGLSFIILINQEWVPTYLGKAFGHEEVFAPVTKIVQDFERAVEADPLAGQEAMFELTEKIMILAGDYEFLSSVQNLIFKWALAGSYFIIVLTILYMIVIVVAKSSVSKPEDQRVKKDLGSILSMSCSWFVQEIVKVFCILTFIPGWYLYIRFMFSGIITAEEKCGPFKALGKSWSISRGQFEGMFLLFMSCVITDVFSIITIIGFIPAMPFKYALRGAVYLQLKQKEVVNG